MTDDGRVFVLGALGLLAAAGAVQNARRGSRRTDYLWKADVTSTFHFDKYTSEDEDEIEFETDGPDEDEAEREAERLMRGKDWSELAEYLVPPVPEPTVDVSNLELIARPRVSFRNPARQRDEED